MEEICREYRATVDAEKRAKDEALDRQAAQAAAEKSDAFDVCLHVCIELLKARRRITTQEN